MAKKTDREVTLLRTRYFWVSEPEVAQNHPGSSGTGKNTPAHQEKGARARADMIKRKLLGFNFSL